MDGRLRLLAAYKKVKASNIDGIFSRKIRFIPCSKRDVGAITRTEKKKINIKLL